MAQVLLCLDDQPDIYRTLRKKINELNSTIFFATTCRVQDFSEYLLGPVPLIAVLIKFDMPFGTGYMFAKMLGQRDLPIIITETGSHGLSKIKEALEEIEYDPKLIYRVDPRKDGWEDEIIQKLNLAYSDNELAIRKRLLKKYIGL